MPFSTSRPETSGAVLAVDEEVLCDRFDWVCPLISRSRSPCREDLGTCGGGSVCVVGAFLGLPLDLDLDKDIACGVVISAISGAIISQSSLENQNSKSQCPRYRSASTEQLPVMAATPILLSKPPTPPPIAPSRLFPNTVTVRMHLAGLVTS